MAANPGDTFGPYEILALIGKGGMGEVYRARDARVGRDVAIKISVDTFSERFDREARAVAALNHPHICTLYDVGPNFLVMELVDGESPKGPLPLDEALRIARELASALEAAHQKGIVHRDLKPANIRVKPDGAVKVLDFGLAKLHDGAAPLSPDENSPTFANFSMTQPGMILGTAAYMAPEQARGKPVDTRADIWAFGVVLYELITGKRPFLGEDVGETLAAVIKEEPKLDGIPKVQRLLRSCLQKDPRKRLRDIGDAWLLLDDDSPIGTVSAPAAAGSARWAWATAIGLGVALSGLAFVHFQETEAVAPPPARFQIPDGSAREMIVSPDGQKLAYAGDDAQGVPRLFVHSLESGTTRTVMEAGTLSSIVAWSPDNQFVAVLADSKIKKINISGGPTQTICELSGGAPIALGSWSPEGVILFPRDGIMRVPATGGEPIQITAVDDARHEVYHRRPTFLPDGRHFVYLRSSSLAGNSGIYVGSLDETLDAQSPKMLVSTPYGAVYAATSDSKRGHLLFMREDTLMAQAFDNDRLELTGNVVSLADSIQTFSTTGATFAASSDVLTFSAGGRVNATFTWRDRQGKLVSQESGDAGILAVSLSPDGTRAAYYRRTSGNIDIWVRDFSRGTTARLTFAPITPGVNIAWSADSRRITFTAPNKNGGYDLVQKAADGSGNEERLLHSDSLIVAGDWSVNDRFLLYSAYLGEGGTADLWVLPRAGSGGSKPFAVVKSDAHETAGKFSPDSRWIAYTSDETGQPEVYVRPFSPDGDTGSSGSKWQISTSGGSRPSWRGDGAEILFQSGDQKLMATPVTANPSFSTGTPQALMPLLDAFSWQPDPKAERFLVSMSSENQNPSGITFVLNWTSLLSQR